jgi:hypothetical protein
VELSAGDELEEPRELVRGGGRHDAGDPDVVAAELLGGRAERGRDRPACSHHLTDAGGVSGGVQRLVGTLRGDGPYGGRQVAGVVDGVRGTEAVDVLLLLPRACGGDDGRPSGGGELERDGSDATGGAGDEHRLPGLDVECFQRVVGGDAGQPDHRGLVGVDPVREAGLWLGQVLQGWWGVASGDGECLHGDPSGGG